MEITWEMLDAGGYVELTETAGRKWLDHLPAEIERQARRIREYEQSKRKEGEYRD